MIMYSSIESCWVQSPQFTWLLLVFNNGGGGSWWRGEEAELLSLSLPSLKLTLRRNTDRSHDSPQTESQVSWKARNTNIATERLLLTHNCGGMLILACNWNHFRWIHCWCAFKDPTPHNWINQDLEICVPQLCLQMQNGDSRTQSPVLWHKARAQPPPEPPWKASNSRNTSYHFYCVTIQWCHHYKTWTQ